VGKRKKFGLSVWGKLGAFDKQRKKLAKRLAMEKRRGMSTSIFSQGGGGKALRSIWKKVRQENNWERLSATRDEEDNLKVKKNVQRSALLEKGWRGQQIVERLDLVGKKGLVKGVDYVASTGSVRRGLPKEARDGRKQS